MNITDMIKNRFMIIQGGKSYANINIGHDDDHWHVRDEKLLNSSIDNVIGIFLEPLPNERYFVPIVYHATSHVHHVFYH